MLKLFIATAAVLGFAGTLASSLSSHALKPALEANGKLYIFNIAANILLFHTFAILFSAILFHLFPKSGFQWAAYSFGIGAILFSGTVFLKSFIEIGNLGILTPIGGLFLFIGWVLMLFSAFRIGM